MITLADEWIDHVERGNDRLSELIGEGGVYCHRFVIGELAGCKIHNRDELLDLVGALPATCVIRTGTSSESARGSRVLMNMLEMDTAQPSGRNQ